MKKINIGVELLRIVSMFMMLLLHFVYQGGLLEAVSDSPEKYLICQIIKAACFGCVNLFALITGYVCLDARNKMNRIVYLWIETFFYSAGISLIFYILPNYDVHIGPLLFSFMPVTMTSYWYITEYVVLFMLIPFINMAINNLQKEKLKITIVILSFLFCIQYVFGINTPNIFNLNYGYSSIWLIYLYICGAYIKKYRVGDKVKKKTYFILYVLFTAGTVISNYLSEYLNGKISIFKLINVNTYNYLFVFLSSICLFLFFVKFECKRFEKVITLISSVSISVYLISVHPMIFHYVIKDMLGNLSSHSAIVIIGALLGASVAVYAVCTIIGLFVRKLFKLIKIGVLSECIALQLKKCYLKMDKIISKVF